MTDFRVRQSIQERFDVDFNRRRRDPLLSFRRRLTWFCGLAAVVVVGGMHLTGNRRIYESRPVSRAHQFFENDCQACHTSTWKPLQRVFLGNPHIRSVSEEACQNCHQDMATHDHSPLMVRDQIQDCVECHREHQGADHELARVPDATCSQCHASLKVTSDATHFFANIESFADHPEFFVVADRQRPDATHDSEPDDATGSRHLASRLVMDAASDGPPLDKARLRFNHALHLSPAGLPVPRGYASADDKGEAGVVQLQCGSCHQPDEAGQYMKPVNFEAHCSSCHQLHFDSRLAELDPELALQGPLPHADPRIIRGLLRSRLLAFAQRHPQRITGAVENDDDELPHKASPNAALADEAKPGETGTAEQQLQWVSQQLATLERFVFREGTLRPITTNRLQESIQAGCAHCHVVESTPQGNWTIAPPNIPSRWMPHSRFRHDRHDTMQCTDCHYRHPSTDNQVEADGSTDNAAELESQVPGEYSSDRLDMDHSVSSDSIYSSQSTADVLMPSISICRQCHGATGGTAGSLGVRSDCSTCHTYHSDLPSWSPAIPTSLSGLIDYAGHELLP